MPSKFLPEHVKKWYNIYTTAWKVNCSDTHLLVMKDCIRILLLLFNTVLLGGAGNVGGETFLV